MTDAVLSRDSRLRAADNGLPFLAAQAAVELKMFDDGKRNDLPSLFKLSDLITNSVDLQGSTSLRSLMDPSTVSVMSQALEESQWSSQKPKTINQLAEVASEIASVMKTQCTSTEHNGDIKRMMDFCVSLARCSSAYRKAVFSPRRKHPYRK